MTNVRKPRAKRASTPAKKARKKSAGAAPAKKSAPSKRAISVRGKKVGPGRIFQEERTYRDAKGKLVRYDAIIAYIRVAPNRTQFTNWSIQKWTEPVARKRALGWLKKKRLEQAKNFA